MTPTTSPCSTFKFHPIALACGLLFTAFVTTAAPINFSQIPAGNGGREPAPNVIISVDNSGSMDWDDVGCRTKISTIGYDQVSGCAAPSTNSKPTRMQVLKAALLAQFGNATASPATKGQIEDGRIRLAWQSMWDDASGYDASVIVAGASNSMKPFTGTHRVNFTNFINSLSPGGGTPSHKMLSNAYNYMKTAPSLNSPWASNPGTSQTTASYLSCRRTYHILLTDGAWNSESGYTTTNTDGNNRTLGDGTTAYKITSEQTRIYRDNNTGTLSDLAFRSWAEDLQPNLANNIRPLYRVSTPEVITNPNSNPETSTTLDPFWNPKNNPANWQSIVQYSIGFSKAATGWLGSPAWDTSTSIVNGTNKRNNNNYGGNGEYAKLVNGTVIWQNPMPSSGEETIRPSELWHSALNGRGRFYPVEKAEDLQPAFEDILNTIITDTSSPLVSIATSSSYLRSGLNAYIAGYNATRYSGSLTARPIDATTGAIQANEVWDAAAKLDALDTSALSSRLVLSFGLMNNALKGFKWEPVNASINHLPTLHKTPLNNNSAGAIDNKGLDRVNYIRGDRSKEVAKGGTLRDRDSRFGDVVNSNIWYTGKPSSGYMDNNYATFRSKETGGFGNRTAMIYVGSNDGMLHGFTAENMKDANGNTITGTDGKELVAYIPQGIAQGGLRELTDADNGSTTRPYVHKYFVDGSPFSGDFYDSGSNKWRTYLIGTLAAGGKGYFVLDVTDPTQFNSNNSTVGDLVIMDTTATTDADIGSIFSPPVVDEAIANKSRQIVKMNNNRWAAILGNGYNSTNEAPVLLIQYLDSTRELLKVSPCSLPTSGTCNYKGENGLSSPQLIDINGDGKVDVAYAGDLKGNVWKFDLTSKTETDWKTSFSGAPFFVAKRGVATSPITQAFTTAPYWLPHPKGGIMLAIATGRNLTDADRATTSIETIYALHDNSTFKMESGEVKFDAPTITTSPINNGSSTTLPTTLVQQTISATPLEDAGTSYFTSSNQPVNYDGTPAVAGPPAQAAVPPMRGWYLDFPLAGQRALQNIRNFSGQRIMVQSLIPKIGSNSTAETCSASATTERSFQAVLNMFTGTPPKTPIFSFSNADTFTKTVAQSVTMVESAAGDTTLIRSEGKTKLLSSNCPAGQICEAKEFNPGTYTGVRAGFRQLQ